MKIVDFNSVTGGDFPVGIKRLEYDSGVDGVRDWGLLLPGRRRALWIVVLHGHGARGDQLYTRKDIRETWLPEFLNTGAGILTLNLRGNAWMSPAAAADLHDVLNYVRAEQGMQKAVFCSGSMGGTSNLIYGVLHPDDVAGIVARGAASDLASYCKWCRTQTRAILKEIADAICAAYGAAPEQAPDMFARHSALVNAARLRMSVYLAHGGADATIPVAQSRALAEKLSGKADFRYHEIPGGNHDAPLHDMQGLRFVLDRLE